MSWMPTLLLIEAGLVAPILDLALGAHPQVMGLGEAARILEMPKPGEETQGPAMLRESHRYERLHLVRSCRCTYGANFG